MSAEDNGPEGSAAAPSALCAYHPERPAVGTCERCGSFYCRSCAGLREGARGFCRRCDEGRAYVPWEDPALGFATRYLRTLRSSITELPKFAAELPMRGGYGRPLWYALFPTLVATLLGAAALALFAGAMIAGFGAANSQSPGMEMVGGLLFAFYSVLGVGGYLAYLALWPAVLLGTARLVGNQRLQYEGLFRILCYGSGFNFLYFVPVVGLLVAVYHAVLSVTCIAAQGRVSTLKALGIFGIPALAFGGCCCGSYFGLLLIGMQ